MGTLAWYAVPAAAILTYFPVLWNYFRRTKGIAGRDRWTLALCVGLNIALFPCALAEYVLKARLPGLTISATGFMLLAARVVLFAWAKRSLGASYTIELRAQPAGLIDSGPYSMVRHPMYAARLMGTIGVPLALNSFATLCLFAPLDLVVVLLRIRAEEKLLVRTWPRVYEEYRSRVGMLTPLRALLGRVAGLRSEAGKETGHVHQ